MKFKRIDLETVRCLISEAELQENGLDMDDFLKSGEKTEDFLRKIIMMAEEEVGYKVPGGFLSVQASILPNHILSLTLSEKQNGILDILKNLKNALTKISDAVRDDDTEAFREILEAMGATDARERIGTHTDEPDQKSPVKNAYQIEFESFDHILHYAQGTYLPVPVQNVVYRLPRNGMYYLVIRKGRLNDDEMCRLLSAALDFSNAIYSDTALLAYLDEYGEMILKGDAIETIRSL